MVAIDSLFKKLLFLFAFATIVAYFLISNNTFDSYLIKKNEKGINLSNIRFFITFSSSKYAMFKKEKIRVYFAKVINLGLYNKAFGES